MGVIWDIKRTQIYVMKPSFVDEQECLLISSGDAVRTSYTISRNPL